MQPHAQDLFDSTLAWSMPWWDTDAHMVWNPPGSMDEYVPERTFHLVPNTAWLAYGMLSGASSDLHQEARAAIDALIVLQYDAPHTEYHGTYAQFLESRQPPANPTMWVDYDPNWRQFVGTTFALTIEDHASRLGPALVDRMLNSIQLAVAGELDGRIPVHYTNPALMRSWLDAWYGSRIGDNDLIAKGEAFARDVVNLHDRHNAFDEYNSPTYSGIDLYALALWTALPPTPFFAEAGQRLTRSLWSQADAFYHPTLRNWCGPFTRSYHPDATRSVTLLALWQWARDGAGDVPLPALDRLPIDHCHDMMAGTVIARLATEIPARAETSRVPRTVERTIGNTRAIHALLQHDWMVGSETSDIDWGGWTQFMPMVAHWRADNAIATMWWHAPRVAHATLHDEHIQLTTNQSELLLRVCAVTPELSDGSVRIGPWRAEVTPTDAVATTRIDPDVTELKFSRHDTAAVSITFTYLPKSAPNST